MTPTAAQNKRPEHGQEKRPKKSIVWLASYPKSGNTWTRIFLANYLLNTKQPLPINQVHRVGIGDSIAKTYRMVARAPIDTNDHKAMLALRAGVMQGIVNNGADVNLVKTHNIRDRAMGVELIPAHHTRSAVYVIRNPLDVVLSFARHFATDPASAADAMGRSDHVTAGDPTTVPQYLGSWSDHVRSWTKKPHFPLLLLRYEDLKTDPHTHFARLVKHLGLEPEEERLDRAIRFSSFEEVQRQETEHGFVERSPTTEKFFHSGQSGAWKGSLAPELVAQIREQHGRVMARHGYE